HRMVESADDPYLLDPSAVIRELFLDDAGRYVQQVWRFDDEQKAWVKDGSPIFPVRRSVRLDFIPFVFVNASGISAAVSKPPLVDLADVNLSHYRTSADLEHGRHLTALPTPWITGWDGSGGEFRIGSSTAWAIANE